MSILTVHRLPALNNARRKWLSELAPGDRVFSCTYTDYVDEAGYGKGEFEEGTVIARDGDLVVQFDDLTTMTYTAAKGLWFSDDGDQVDDSAWIIPAEGEVARQLRRILATAHVMFPDKHAVQQRAHVIAQLRRMISGVNGPSIVGAAERLLTHYVQIQQDLKALSVPYFTEDHADPLAA